MNHKHQSGHDLPLHRTLAEFDLHSGSILERSIFNHRRWVLSLCLLVTAVLGWGAFAHLSLNASYERMMPQSHPYIVNYLENRQELRGLGNVLRVVVENLDGDIFDPGYQAKLRDINDELFLTPGVDRAWLKSLWTPSVRWTEVTEDGSRGGPVMPESYDGSPQAREQLRLNIARAGIAGRLVAADFRSSMILVPLLDGDVGNGQALDYQELSETLERNIRQRFETAGDASVPHVRIHMIGFAKLVGDLIAGLQQVLGYFLVAAVIASAILFWHTRCVRSTLLVIGASLVAVVWQLGFVGWLGYALDPFSVLVPFLIFAIGVSHGAQKMNGIMQDIGRGAHRLVAARHTFRRLFVAGLTALLADAVGFGVLMVIDIPVIRDMTLIASIGVAVLILTNLILLPVLLSYVGVSPTAAARSLHADRHAAQSWLDGLTRFTERRWATGALVVAGLLTVGGFLISLNLQTGDLQAGAPELRADSRYNRDNAYVGAHYSLSSDQFAVIVRTTPDNCASFETLVEADRLAWALRQVDGVQMTAFLGDTIRQITAGSNEGNPKWITLSRNQDVLNYGSRQASFVAPELVNIDCSVMPVIAYLRDHRAATLEKVVAVADAFAREHSGDQRQFLLAAGNAGIEAATNNVVKAASRSMLFYVYGAVILLCFITFRDWRAVLVAVVPLVMTSILCEALMVVLGIGVKVATLPVIALGVGIGVDYALYLLSIQLARQHAGESLSDAYRRSLQFTGKVVALVGITLAAGVFTWAWSPIKFQADMGILLTFMLLWNMVGALVLIPALSHFLLQRAGQVPAGKAS